jgi:hypothetical protein
VVEHGIGGLAASLTIWAAVLAWLVGEWRRTTPGAPPTHGRAAWTLGALLSLVHGALAFHVHHGWSHAAALADTAARTAEVAGWPSGLGLFVNYGFLVLWASDALWWWVWPRSFAARARGLDGAIRAFLWFLFLNGAFVFARSPQRWAGLLAVVGVPAAWYRARGSRS